MNTFKTYQFYEYFYLHYYLHLLGVDADEQRMDIPEINSGELPL